MSVSIVEAVMSRTIPQLPSLPLVAKVPWAVYHLVAFLFRIDGKVRFDDLAETVPFQSVETVIEKVQVENVLSGNALVHHSLHDLKQNGGLSAPTHSY